MLIRNAEVAGETLDLRIEGDRILAIGRGLPGDVTLDANGGALLPGLHDHHIHLLALAASLDSVRCGPPEVRTLSELGVALGSASPRHGWLRGTGYHESVAGDLDRHTLDRLAPGRPVRVQHRSGAMWCLSSAALEALGIEELGDHPGIERDDTGRATGRLFGLDDWLRTRLPSGPRPDLARVGGLLLSRGVTGVTDATPGNDETSLAWFGALPQSVVAMGPLGLETPGAVKILLRESELPAPEELADTIRRAHETGRRAAIHCVTRAELVVAASALASAGCLPGDRIEHASVAPPDIVALLAALPVTVVTQPNFLLERGDAYLTDVEARDRSWLYRCQGFLEAGIALGGGTDAPFGAADPWLAIRAAVDRRSAAGVALGEDEALSPERAMGLFTTSPHAPGGPARRITVGAAADLCLLDRPWKQARDRLDAGDVTATILGGSILNPRG